MFGSCDVLWVYFIGSKYFDYRCGLIYVQVLVEGGIFIGICMAFYCDGNIWVVFEYFCYFLNGIFVCVVDCFVVGWEEQVLV